MVLKGNFDVVDMAGEYIVVPTGKEAVSFKGVVALSEASAFLLKNMKEEKTEDELVELLCSEYDVGSDVARADIKGLLTKLLDMGVIEE